MKKIGVTGPTGAGKTTVLTALSELGCATVDCDGVYHRLLDTSPALLRELTARFGDSILDAQGGVCRPALGRLVFGDPQALEALNAIAHRHVLEETDRLTREAERSGCPGVVYDAIALWESGLGGQCHVTVAVIAPPEVRLERIMARDGIEADYARARMEAQKPLEYYVNQCDHVLVNDGAVDAETLKTQVKALFTPILF